MSLLDFFTGGKSGQSEDALNKALQTISAVKTPTQEELTLPELQQYAVAMGMTPAQMQAFLQANNAYDKPVDQTGTAAQIAAINQLSGVANAGAEGSATQQAQIAQVNQDAARNLAGQRGAIDQMAQARGVSPGMLQAALGQVQAGQGQQDAHMAALQAQGQNYQQALAAMASGASAGSALQGQQNTQANTVAQAQNAMQQFNAANQQNASSANAGFQQQANSQNALNANQVGTQNTGLANQQKAYNAALPQQVYNNEMGKAQAMAGQYGNIANNYTGQGNANMGIMGGLTGLGVTTYGGGNNLGGSNKGGGGTSSGGGGGGNSGSANNGSYDTSSSSGGEGQVMSMFANKGGIVGHEQCYHDGGICLTGGGTVPGKARVSGDSLRNDTVPARLSPGEAVIPRTTVQQNPSLVQNLLKQGHPHPTHHPHDIASLLAAMKHMRGA